MRGLTAHVSIWVYQAISGFSEGPYQLNYPVPEVRKALTDPVLYLLIHDVQAALHVCLLLQQNLLQLCLLYQWACHQARRFLSQSAVGVRLLAQRLTGLTLPLGRYAGLSAEAASEQGIP